MIIQQLKEWSWEFREMGQISWHKAQIPGTLFLDMMRNGMIKEPYYRFNERQFQKLAEKDYEYRCVFQVDSKFISKKKQFIVFEGIDTIAEIYLNGHELAATDDMHRIYRFAIDEKVVLGVNELYIKFYSPMEYIRKQHEEHPLPEFNTASPHGFSQIRKAHSSFGWDAEPVVPDSGLWRDVYLEGYDNARLDSLYVRQFHNNGKVKLDIEIFLDIEEKGEYIISLELLKPNGEIEALGKVSTTSNKGIWSIDVSEPELWWPNGYGKQPLYQLKAVLDDDQITEEKKDKKELYIGLRKMEVRRENDQWGESFAFYVNDTPVFAKGGCYTPPDKFLTLCRGERHQKLIEYCAKANYNCIRVWGGAVYPDDEFYDLCDRYGILIWQDLMFACALYHVTDEFVEKITQETADNVKRLRNHASLVLWCGSNENEWFHDFDHDIEGLTYELRMNNLKQYEVYLKETLKQHDPDRLYWPSSPSSGGGYIDPNGYEKGDVHCWYVWYLPAKPYTFYRECKARFVSEFGLESFQSIKTLQHYMEPEDMSPNSEVMDYMQRCSDNYCNMGNGKIMNYIFQEVRPPENFQEYIFASQYAQAEGIKYGANHFRRLKPRCMGSLYWQIVDCFPGTTWSGIDYEYRWKILHYYAKRFYQETVVSGAETGNITEIYVVHDGQREFPAQVLWKLRNSNGQILKENREKIIVKKNSSEIVEKIDLSNWINEDNRNSLYLEMQLLDEQGNILSSDTNLFVKPKHFKFEKPEITWNVQETKEEFEILLKTSVYTKCIQLDLKNQDALFSDNCFDLSPDQCKLIKVRKDEISKIMTKTEFQKELCYQCLNTLGMHERREEI